MTLSDQDLRSIANILLNKNEEKPWYYFNLNLSEILPDNPSKISHSQNQGIDSLLKKIEDQGGEPNNGTAKLSMVINFLAANPEIIKRLCIYLFNLAEIPNKSDADKGLIGKFNEKDRAYRNSIFFEQIKKKGRNGRKLILAEGDSWFQFPRIFLGFDLVKDIIDHLMDRGDYLVYSLAYGGDWLSNILSLDEYVDELPKLSPDAFLISGGGNDLVGGLRLATMVYNPFLNKLDQKEDSSEKPDLGKNGFLYKLLEIRRGQFQNGTRSNTLYKDKLYTTGLPFIRVEFFEFLNLIMLQYFLFMYDIVTSGKYPDMMIITQGYDFVVPKKQESPHKWPFSWLYHLLDVINDNGSRLRLPLRLKGIDDEYEQEAVLYVIIYELNEMLIQLAEFKLFKNVFHIDSRKIAEYDSGDWFDELHLKSAGFGRVSELYHKCIKAGISNVPSKKVFTKADLN